MIKSSLLSWTSTWCIWDPSNPTLGGDMGFVFWFESSIIFLSVLLWFLNYNMYYDKGNDAIKHLGFLFPGCHKSPRWVNRKPIVRIDLCLLLWTIKDTCQAQTCQRVLWFLQHHAGPSSPPAVWLLNQTTLFNYSELLIQRPLLLFLN